MCQAFWGMLSLVNFEGSRVDVAVEVVKVSVSTFEAGELVVDETEEGGSVQRVLELWVAIV